MQFSLFQKIREKLDQVITGRGRIDEDLFEELEILMIQADINVQTTSKLLTKLREGVETQKLTNTSQVVNLLEESIVEILEVGKGNNAFNLYRSATFPTLYLVIGVNGVGKTTSIAKLCNMLQKQGKRVILAAGDTFRAAAIDQLQIWADRSGAEMVKHREGADPSAVVFDAVKAAKARGVDFVVADTAGRLHTRANLMEELKKIHRIARRELDRDPDEILLVLDATTGQNGISQAKLFLQAMPVTGIILTKLDSTARGGIVISIADELKLPIKLTGTGEQIDKIALFNARQFAKDLLS